MERVPIDKAVMEKAANVRVLEVVYDWNDVGDWRALTALVPPDADGNTIQGDVVARDTTDSIIVSDDGGLIATLGRRRPGDRPVGRGDAGRPQGPARQAQGAGRGAGQAAATSVLPHRATRRPMAASWARFRARGASARRVSDPRPVDRHAAGGLRAARRRPGRPPLPERWSTSTRSTGSSSACPVHTGGREGTSADWPATWGDWLAEVTGLPVVYHDERYTTVEAEDVLIALGTQAAKAQGAARHARRPDPLQNYLDAGCPETERPARAARRSPIDEEIAP